jgi:hypothetical protein
MRELFPERINIVAEGDSWFAYPPEWFIVGKPSNLIKHLSSFTQGKANFLTLASNGDEAVDMVTGKQKHILVQILRWHENNVKNKPIDLLLFSGGGNDIVGKNDFERFIIQDATTCTDAISCINLERLNRKVHQIALAYEELLDIRDHYSPETIIMTHTYDYPFPSLQGGNFLGGLIKTKGWVKRFMDAANIKEELQAEVIKIFMDTMASKILSVASRREKFIVIDTRKTLTGKKAWLNEIHPTSKGFKKVARSIYEQMKQHFPDLS